MCQFYKDKHIWWIPNSRLFVPREHEPKHDHFPVRLCTKCNKVWEKPLKYTRHNKTIFHDSFPTYGLTREVCHVCIKKRKEKIYASRTKKEKLEINEEIIDNHFEKRLEEALKRLSKVEDRLGL